MSTRYYCDSCNRDLNVTNDDGKGSVRLIPIGRHPADDFDLCANCMEVLKLHMARAMSLNVKVQS